MAYIFQHKQDCVKELGESFEEVHLWLDEYSEKLPVNIFQDQHRKHRHHKGGIEKVREMWGDQAARAAEIHILRDMGFILER